IWYMNHVTVLVLGEDRKNGRPSAFHLVFGVKQFRSGRVDVRFGLQPSRQSSTAGASSALDQIAKEQAFVGVAAGKNEKVL
ncbi:unnamed protein product, partial [Nesidiocoris tenuis]